MDEKKIKQVNLKKSRQLKDVSAGVTKSTFVKCVDWETLPLHTHTQDDRDVMFAFPYLFCKCVNVLVVDTNVQKA